MAPAELLEIVYHFYPRGITVDDPRWRDAPEHRRLEEVARAAGRTKKKWSSMISRLCTRFPECNMYSNPDHLLAGRAACYSGTLFFPRTPERYDDRIAFMVSFLAPFYALCSLRTFPTAANRPPVTCLVPNEAERLCWEAIADEIEATYDVRSMPADVGHIIVPDVQPGNRRMGEAMIYDCFFDDNPRLVSGENDFALALQQEYAALQRRRGQ